METIKNMFAALMRVLFFLCVVVPLIGAGVGYWFGYKSGVIDGTFYESHHAIYHGENEYGFKVFSIEDGPAPVNDRDKIRVEAEVVENVIQMQPPSDRN